MSVGGADRESCALGVGGVELGAVGVESPPGFQSPGTLIADVK